MDAQIVVLGGSGGLGREVCKLLPDATNWSADTRVQLSSMQSIGQACDAVGPVKGIINCCGINELRKFADTNSMEFVDTMLVNAYALVRVVHKLMELEKLQSGAAVCNVISNAAHMPMTHSLSYCASKAAQEMITRQMARELKQFCIFGVNPNKLRGTGMSLGIERQVCNLRGWTPEEAARYQLAALPAGVETEPAACARFIVDLMQPIHHPFITGCIFPYGGPQ